MAIAQLTMLRTPQLFCKNADGGDSSGICSLHKVAAVAALVFTYTQFGLCTTIAVGVIGYLAYSYLTTPQKMWSPPVIDLSGCCGEDSDPAPQVPDGWGQRRPQQSPYERGVEQRQGRRQPSARAQFVDLGRGVVAGWGEDIQHEQWPVAPSKAVHAEGEVAPGWRQEARRQQPAAPSKVVHPGGEVAVGHRQGRRQQPAAAAPSKVVHPGGEVAVGHRQGRRQQPAAAAPSKVVHAEGEVAVGHRKRTARDAF